MTRRIALAAAGALSLALLSGCQDAPEAQPDRAATDTNQTLAAAMSEAPGLSVTTGILRDAGLIEVFDGMGSYTILAPEDDAFGRLDEATRQTLSDPESRALATAVLRNHIVPGYLSPEDIANAIRSGNGESVEMATVGDSTITFTLDGEEVTATLPDGESAVLSAVPTLATNGVVVPVDHVMGAMPATGAE